MVQIDSSIARSARARLGDSLLLFILGAAWGLQFTLLKIATGHGLGETGVLTGSIGLLALIYLAALGAAGAWFRPACRHLRFFLASGLLGFVLPLGAVIFAAHRIPAGVIVLMESLTPVCTVTIALALRTERITRRRALALALGASGVLLVFASALIEADRAYLAGVAIALFIPLIWAVDGIYVAARWPADLRPIQVVAGEATAGALLALPLTLLAGDGADAAIGIAAQLAAGPAADPGLLALLCFVGISLVEGYVYLLLLRRAGAVLVSFGSFIALFTGILWGMALLGESHPPALWLAVGLTALALYLVLDRRSDTEGAARPDGTAASTPGRA